VDPLTKDFAYYSPYQFSGNNPIFNIDLDGNEPKSFMWELMRINEAHTKWNYTVSTVIDPINKQVYTIMHYPNSNNYYSWKNNNGTDGIFTGDNVQDGKWTGYWQRYELPEVKYAKTLGDLSTGMAKGSLALTAVIVAAPLAMEALPALSTSGEGLGTAGRFLGTQSWRGLSWVGRTFGKDLLLETSKEFLANRGDVRGMDWIDVGSSTIASKFGWMGQIGMEAINASFDFSAHDGFQSVFTGNKSVEKTGVDMIFGSMQVGSNAIFGEFSKNSFRDYMSDVSLDQAKTTLNDTFEDDKSKKP